MKFFSLLFVALFSLVQAASINTELAKRDTAGVIIRDVISHESDGGAILKRDEIRVDFDKRARVQDFSHKRDQIEDAEAFAKRGHFQGFPHRRDQIEDEEQLAKRGRFAKHGGGD